MVSLLLIVLLSTAGCSLPALVQTAAPAAADDDHDHGHGAPRPRSAPDDLTDAEATTVRLFREAVPTVVLIRTVSQSPVRGAAPGRALGSGVLISPSCHVLTAAHVVDGATSIAVRTHDGQDREAELLFSEPGADIALLALKDPDPSLPHAELGDSDRLAVGQDLFVIGNPRGLENTFTRGILSAFREFGRLYDGTILVEFLQTDAAINSGNSGGPVFDSQGRVVGIASRISTQSGGSEGLGFAVTVNSAKLLLALEDRRWTGLTGVYLSERDLTTLFHLELPGALLVQRVEQGSPAARAGLRGGTIPSEIAGRRVLLGGDLVLEYGGQHACHSACLAAAHEEISDSDTVTVVYLRGGQRHEAVMDLRASRRNFLD